MSILLVGLRNLPINTVVCLMLSAAVAERWAVIVFRDSQLREARLAWIHLQRIPFLDTWNDGMTTVGHCGI